MNMVAIPSEERIFPVSFSVTESLPLIVLTSVNADVEAVMMSMISS